MGAKKKISVYALSVISSVALVSSLSVSGAPRAEAALSQCGTNRACAWWDQNYSGTFGYWTSSQSYLSGWNDVISSTMNHRSGDIGWWTDAGYSGLSMIYGPGVGGYYVWPHIAENSISSVYFY